MTQGSILPTLAATKSLGKRRAAFASCTSTTVQDQSKKGIHSKVVKEIAGKSSTASDCDRSIGLISTSSKVITKSLSKDIVPTKKMRRAGMSTLSELSNVTSEGQSKGRGKSSLLKNSKAHLAFRTPVHDCYENVLKLVTRQSMGLQCNIGTKQVYILSFMLKLKCLTFLSKRESIIN